ncbi:MAG: hypothetical protein J0I77_10975 [Rudaea sp.]|uniref:hypothetical protein n=1 Tax=unclassified Rudaea TaxID=2627037 RepID=UPI0010F87A1E|nr:MULTISPECIES: hypothetical protein [unclassified Rudaea]MBN8886235.1 hypothetical protein [Rudaea sp.]MBR0346074.1 hypothetical protein [Rudaea sp.]
MARLVFKDHSLLWHNGSDYPKIPLTVVSWDSDPDTAVAYVYFGHVNVDFDGSPTAYAPPGSGLTGDDDLGNAFDSTHWFGVVALSATDAAVQSGDAQIDQRDEVKVGGKFPVIQQAKNDDPNPGYYVSSTPQPTGAEYRQDSYVDASRVAYGALSDKFQALGVALGDYGLALRHDQNLQSGFYFVDTGYGYKLGECSHKVGKDLGGSGRGNSFNNNFPVSFIVFPQSGTQDPRGIVSASDDAIADALKPLLTKLSAAENANELPMLMGYNEIAPQGQPSGTAKLAAYKQNPAGATRPSNYDNLAEALKSWGYSETDLSLDL